MNHILIWRFPEIGLPPNHPYIDGIFHEINHPAMGYPHSSVPQLGPTEGVRLWVVTQPHLAALAFFQQENPWEIPWAMGLTNGKYL
jgi:hypothetical protein